jgi:very-long-chain (3R)-3-hydroxyacyl-CoA dehydratase
VTDRYIQFRLAKVGKGEVWPRLTFAKEKYPWLKVDFDHLSYEGESEEDAGPEEEQVVRILSITLKVVHYVYFVHYTI